MTKRALFIKTKNLGDAVVMTAAIQALPEDFIVQVLCFEDCAAIYEGLDRVEQVWTVERGLRGISAVKEGLRLFFALRHFHFDLLCQFSDDWRGAVLARTLHVAESVAARSDRRPDFWHRSFTVIARRSNVSRRHAAELDVDLLRAARLFTGEAPAYSLTGLKNETLDPSQAPEFYGLQAKQYIVLHLASRWSFKELAVETARDLIRGIAAHGWRVVLSGAESDRDKLQVISQGLDSTDFIPFVGKPIPIFSSLLSQSRALVSIDSFAVHLASAHGVPTVAIYGPSGELNWRPWRTPYRAVTQSDLYPCRPCGMDGCAGSKASECLRTLPSIQILEAVRDLLAESSGPLIEWTGSGST